MIKLHIKKRPSWDGLFRINLRKIIEKINSKNYLTYGFDKNANYQIININYKLGKTSFSLKVKSSGKKKLLIKNIWGNK